MTSDLRLVIDGVPIEPLTAIGISSEVVSFTVTDPRVAAKSLAEELRGLASLDDSISPLIIEIEGEPLTAGVLLSLPAARAIAKLLREVSR